MSATSCPPSITVTYSGGKVSAMSFISAFVLAADFELVFNTAVLPPEMLAASTPSVRRIGKLNGEMMSETPYGIL